LLDHERSLFCGFLACPQITEIDPGPEDQVFNVKKIAGNKIRFLKISRRSGCLQRQLRAPHHLS